MSYHIVGPHKEAMGLSQLAPYMVKFGMLIEKDEMILALFEI